MDCNSSRIYGLAGQEISHKRIWTSCDTGGVECDKGVDWGGITAGEPLKQLTSGCPEMTVLFSRGTCEAGNIGDRVGPQLFKRIQEQLVAEETTDEAPPVAIRGVEYKAPITGFLEGGDAAGGVALSVLLSLS